MAKINFLIIAICIMNISYVFAQFNNTTPFNITQDGSCGVKVNKTCGNFDCCSPVGFCGGTSAYCGDGCQKDYGFCGFHNDSLKIIDTCQSEKTLALTFDDGPRQWTNELLDELKKHHIKATFLVNGHNALNSCIYNYADILQRMYKEGHQIGSHSWSHPHLAQVSPKEVNYQISKLDTAFVKILGATPRFFRPPFGEAINYDALRSRLIKSGYNTFAMWDVDTNDFLGNVSVSKELFLKGINDTKSHIILNHDTTNTTITELVPFYIETAKNLGYKFDTIAGCNGINDTKHMYKSVGKPQARDKTWVCTPDDMHL